MLGVIFVYGLFIFAIYIAFFSPDDSKNVGSNQGSSEIYNDQYTQIHRTNKIDNSTSRNLPTYGPRFKNDIVVPDNTKKRAQSTSTQTNDSPVITVDNQEKIYMGLSKPPAMLGQIGNGGSKTTSRPLTATEAAREEKLEKDRELNEKVALAKQRANRILGNNQ